MQVLVVEDDVTIRSLIHEILVDEGHDVFVANDGYQGLLRARETVPDVILMDIKLPVMDGVTASRRLKDDPKLDTCAIIAMSAGGNLRRHYRQMAVDGMLEKPFDIASLLDVVDSTRTKQMRTQR